MNYDFFTELSSKVHYANLKIKEFKQNNYIDEELMKTIWCHLSPFVSRPGVFNYRVSENGDIFFDVVDDKNNTYAQLTVIEGNILDFRGQKNGFSSFLFSVEDSSTYKIYKFVTDNPDLDNGFYEIIVKLNPNNKTVDSDLIYYDDEVVEYSKENKFGLDFDNLLTKGIKPDKSVKLFDNFSTAEVHKVLNKIIISADQILVDNMGKRDKQQL